MKVIMRIKPDMLYKIPSRTMPVGEHIVRAEAKEYEINEDNVHHLESVGTKHWVEITKPEKPSRKRKVLAGE